MSHSRTAVLLVNLGTPAAPTVPAVRRYLAEFLADARVVELPRWLWLPILHGVVLRTRPRRSARAYASVWTAQGSPLLAITIRQAGALREHLATHVPALRIEIAMRYGEPALGKVLENLLAEGIEQVLVLPLYPQFSATTTASVFDAVTTKLRQLRNQPALRWVRNYAEQPRYIAALAQSIRAHWAANGRAEKLLLSFHGIPKRNIERGDPYYSECQASAKALAKELQLEADDWLLCFQSRFGKAEWLQPYTDRVLVELARAGVNMVDVICPGFAADCLETLEEIEQQFKALFLTSGGREFRYIPALNDQPAHIEMLAELIKKHTADW